MLHEIEPVLLVRVHDRFRIGAPAKDVTFALQARPQFRVVVDLAVEGDPDRTVLVRQRLPAGFAQVEDAQTPVPQGDSRGHVRSLRVRAAVHEGRLHDLDQLLVGPIETGDSTHVSTVAKTSRMRLALCAQLKARARLIPSAARRVRRSSEEVTSRSAFAMSRSS